jgi:hypothetical protein
MKFAQNVLGITIGLAAIGSPAIVFAEEGSSRAIE